MGRSQFSLYRKGPILSDQEGPAVSRTVSVRSGVRLLRNQPAAVGQFVVPVLESDNGEIIQDSGDIIDFLENRHAEPLLNPQTPVRQFTLSLIFDVFGSEYLLPLAMHYRWSYRGEQETFLVPEIRASAGRGR